MESKKKVPELKDIIFEIAENNGTVFDLAKNKKIKYQSFELLNNLGLLDFENTESEISSEKGDTDDYPMEFFKFKQDIETLQKITKILDNKELSRFMRTRYYKDGLKYYYTTLINSLNENKLYPLPDTDYIEYALKNSPSNVRFFLLDNDVNTLRSFYQRCVTLTNKNAESRIKIEILEKYNMYLVWDNLIFGKIQEDLQNKILLDPVNYFAGYLPLAKKTLEKLVDLSNLEEKEEKKLLLKVGRALGSLKK